MKMAMLGACAGVSAVAVGLGLGAGGGDGGTLRPAVAWAGDNSLITTERFERITTRERWEEVWKEHAGEPGGYQHPAYPRSPEIDFDRCMVVAYFRGSSTNNAGERVKEIDEVGGTLRIRFDSMSYQTSSGVTHLRKGEFDPNNPGALDVKDHGNKVTPYGIWVIERTDKPVVIEEGVRSLKSEPVTWKEQHRFEAMK